MNDQLLSKIENHLCNLVLIQKAQVEYETNTVLKLKPIKEVQNVKRTEKKKK